MVDTRDRSAYGGAAVILIVVFALLHAAIVDAACGCASCLYGSACVLTMGDDTCGSASTVADGDDDVVASAEFQANSRWGTTATLGSSSSTWGTPQTLTWGIVADGTWIDDSYTDSGSDLIATMDSLYGAGRTVDTAPWFTFFEQSFARWSELSGLTYVYEPNDGGADIDNTSSPRGQLGVYADVRIGGHRLDGGGSVLAYNYFPTHGDMVIDTSDTSNWNNRSNNSRFLRNVIMHEAGHGLGLSHLESNNSGQLMEPSINTGFDGPQIDDILGVQRLYGDAWEKDGGNDLTTTAMDLGDFAEGETWSIGADGDSNTVSSSQVDFISIDDDSDIDYFKFTVATPVEIDVTVTQVGRTYNEGPQDGTQTELDTATLNELEVDLQLSDGGRGATTLISGVPGRGVNSKVVDNYLLSPGEYFVRVTGTENNVQLYRLDLVFFDTVIPGDYNSDGLVDEDDYAVWAAYYGSGAEDLPAGIEADGNGNGLVDAADYVLWRDAWENPTDSLTVPEPAAAALLLIAFASGRRRAA